MTPFFITGLPRTRTAWLANYMTYGSTACFHDLMHRFTLFEIASNLRKTGCSHIGYSDPALLLHWKAIVEDIPDARWLIIQRDIQDVARTWDTVLGQDSTEHLRELQGEIRNIRTMIPRALHVHFDDIDTRIDEIEGHLAPGAHFPKWRHEMLRKMNVQVTPKSIIEAIQGDTKIWA